MSDTPVRFVGSIPEQYDRSLGPLFFIPYAKDLVARLPTLKAGTLLEIACGTGLVTEQLRARFPSTVTIVATDLSDPMLTYARTVRKLDGGVDWKIADAQSLPFADGTVDMVVCQFGLMFVPDKALAFREARRVLKPGGTFAFSVWASLAENPMTQIADAIVHDLFPDDPPTFYQIPFGLDDEPGLRKMLGSAGFTVDTVERVRIPGSSPSARDAAHGLVFGTPALLGIQDRGTVAPEKVADVVTDALAAHGGVAPFQTPMSALVFVAKAV